MLENFDLDEIIRASLAKSSKAPKRSPQKLATVVASHRSYDSVSCRGCPSVSFGKVETRVYERVLGDNPACDAGGPSISLGWRYKDKKAVDLDKHYAKLHREAPQRRKRKDQALTCFNRVKIALELGYSKEEIQDNMVQVRQVQAERVQTIKAVEKEEYLERWPMHKASCKAVYPSSKRGQARNSVEC